MDPTHMLEELNRNAPENPWRLEESDGVPHLTKRYSFDNFAAALAFTNRIGKLAEQANHHPDLKLGWGYVVINLTTHSAGTVTDKDLSLAAACDQSCIR